MLLVVLTALVAGGTAGPAEDAITQSWWSLVTLAEICEQKGCATDCLGKREDLSG